MRILVTNDDGIHAEGLWVLTGALKELGDVCVVAPDRDLSGSGTAMTLVDVVRAQQVSSPVDDVEAYSVQGTPADCVILAFETLFDGPFDLVASGINAGANLGLDVLSSGTVGGALQGYYNQVPSIAVSSIYGKGGEVRYEAAARAATALARGLAGSPSDWPPVLNVNLPDVGPEGIEGVEMTRLGPRAYLENVETGKDGRRTHYWIKHNRPVIDHPAEGTDLWATRNNRVSITPIDLVSALGTPPPELDALADSVRSALGLRG